MEWLRISDGETVTGTGTHQYRVAGIPLAAPRPIPGLEAWDLAGKTDASRLAAPPLPQCLALPPAESRSRRVSGPLAGAERDVEIAPERDRWRLAIEGIGRFRVGRVSVEGPPVEGPELPLPFLEALLGPALLFLFALRARWALHASAARDPDGRAWLFLGDSGVGKSTLARSTAAIDGWLPLADDIVPVSVQGERLEAWPWFPQLKLAPAAQYGAVAPERLDVAGICLLEPLPADATGSIDPLGRHESALGMLRQAVASRLFPPALHARQFRELGAVTAGVRGYRLGVPRRLAALPEVLALLREADEA